MKRSTIGIIAGVAVAIVGLPAMFMGGGTNTLACQGVQVSTVALQGQSVAGYNGDQLDNAATIVNVAASMQLPQRASVIGVMTAMGESGLRNLAYGDDVNGVTNPDGSLTCSLGIFQQQWCLAGNPWGDRDDVLDPGHAAGEFFERLMRVPGWESMDATEAAHAVQRNADPNHYAKWEPAAEEVVTALGGGGCTGETTGEWVLPVSDPVTSPYGPRRIICNDAGCSTPWHYGLDFGSACGTPVAAIAGGTVTFTGAAGGFGNRVIIDHGGGIESIYGHMSASYNVTQGQAIPAGTVVGTVGGTGVGTGCHLDLKVRVNGEHVDPQEFLRGQGIAV